MPQQLTRTDAWLAAARPRTLPAAIAPVLVGSGLAAGDGVFRWDSFLLALVGALSIQIAANFANDVSDARRGADTADRVGPPRMVASGTITPRSMWLAVAAAVAVSAIAGVLLTLIAGPVILVIGVVSVIAMLTYVGGPIPYGYRGLGEVMVFVFFGLVATVGTRFAHDGAAPLDAWVLAVVMGMLAAAILVANNLRDIDTDERVGKRTLAVMIGRDRTRRLFVLLLVGPFVVIALAAALGATPPATGFAVLLLPMTRPLIWTALRESEGTALIGLLAGTARLQLLVAIFLTAGAALS